MAMGAGLGMFSMMWFAICFAISVLGVYALVLAIKALRIYIDKNTRGY